MSDINFNPIMDFLILVGPHFKASRLYNFLSILFSTGNPLTGILMQGTGSFGPETMVDIKFSPLSFFIAILGGSNLAFHFSTLLFLTFALYFLAKKYHRASRFFKNRGPYNLCGLPAKWLLHGKY
jgi:hypothetical protein